MNTLPLEHALNERDVVNGVTGFDTIIAADVSGILGLSLFLQETPVKPAVRAANPLKKPRLFIHSPMIINQEYSVIGLIELMDGSDS